jgi:hypothetical protein
MRLGPTGLIPSCAQTGNFFVAAGLTVKTQIPLNPPLANKDFSSNSL